MKQGDNTIHAQLDKSILDNINKLFSAVKKGREFEVMFNNYKLNENRLTSERFNHCLNYMKYVNASKGLQLKRSVTLDVVYTDIENMINYRAVVKDNDFINRIMSKNYFKANHVIFKGLIGLSKNEKIANKISIMKKMRSMDVVDVDDFDIRFRLSDELSVSEKELKMLQDLDETTRTNIAFRHKDRITLILHEKDGSRIHLDATITKQTKNVNKLESVFPIYEVEIDFEGKPEKSFFDIIMNETTVIIKILNQTNYLLSKTMSNSILDKYANLVGDDTKTMINLKGRKAESLEIQYVIDILPNQYAVTDKADGERYFLIIIDLRVYLISYTLDVKFTGIELPKKLEKYNNTILDGEHIFVSGNNRYIFMAFDCLYNGDNDVRSESDFIKRLGYIDNILTDCFNMSSPIAIYSGDFNVSKILDFHDKNITKFITQLKNDIKTEKMFLVRRKYFIPVLGGADNEIYKYSKLLWEKYTTDQSSVSPYVLDGLVYHPLNQKYEVSVKESKYSEYKWKPPTKNSIDFYITIERDKETGRILTLFDNSSDDDLEDKPYRIIYLHCGRINHNKEQPVLFQEKEGRHLAYIYLKDGVMRDIEGNIIQDKTVVEFYYNNDPSISPEQRWVPIRTRYDKTESVNRYGKKYGNYITVAQKVWRSIKNPFLMDDIIILSNDNTTRKHIEVLSKKIDHSVIKSQAAEDKYYQIRTKIAGPMKNFHNWLKSIVIYTHCNPVYEGKNVTVLDIACGRGGDIMKFYYAKVDMYVGIDIDNNGLISPVDGAISRYNQLRRTHPNFPRSFFIHADGGSILDYNEQLGRLGPMTNKNRDLMNKFFSKDPKKRTMFDRLNCQFAIHYFFANNVVWNNFMQNINMYLKEGGYLLITTFDGDRIMDALKGKEKFTSYYTNTQGEKKILFELVKQYDDEHNDGIGMAIDVHNALYSQEGVYITEYLVKKAFIEKELSEHCNMELVETDLFENQFYIHEDYFKTFAKEEHNPKTRKFLLNAGQYYDQNDEINQACFQMTKLNRYYVFRKKETQKGGSFNVVKDIPFEEGVEYVDPEKFIKRQVNDKTFSLLSSIHNILQEEGVVPTKTDMYEMYKDLDYSIQGKQDNYFADRKNLDSLSRKFIIDHENNDNVVNILNGINILVFNQDNGITIHGSSAERNFNRESKTIILYQEDGIYYPVFKQREDHLQGLFNTRTQLIRRLVDASDVSLLSLGKKSINHNP